MHSFSRQNIADFRRENAADIVRYQETRATWAFVCGAVTERACIRNSANIVQQNPYAAITPNAREASAAHTNINEFIKSCILALHFRLRASSFPPASP